MTLAIGLRRSPQPQALTVFDYHARDHRLRLGADGAGEDSRTAYLLRGRFHRWPMLD